MLATLIPVLGPILDKVLGSVLPDQGKRQEVIMTVFSLLGASDIAQTEVNKAEASSGNWFAAGWRPMIGWSCAVALAFQYVLSPLLMWVAELTGHPLPAPPKLDDVLWELMFGMLGMAGLRSIEKVKGLVK
ncbi:3TM-type holin [Ferrovibrio sp.]|uniref:3TM-type holin n=1 Tax=Ferrovibrio sp. TaxID=1917215 RepID=UPI00311DBD69